MNKKILVIEDEKPLLEAIKIKLNNGGYEVYQARSATEALNKIKEIGEVDAIWLDHYLLGGEEGISFVAEVKSGDSPLKNVPIFLVSNTATPDKIQSYIALGVKKYFTKANFKMDDIIKDIDELVGSKE